MRGLLIAAAAIATIPSLLAPRGVPQSAEGTLLVPGSIFERHIARGDDHRFQLTISPGVVTIVVEQRGIDLRMLVRDASGAVIDDVQDAQGASGEERTEIATNASVTLTLSVQAAPGTVAAGDSRIRVDDPRRAAADDGRLQEARTLRARALPLEGKGRSPAARDRFSERSRSPNRYAAPMTPWWHLVSSLPATLQRQENTQARALYEQAIRSFEKAFGPDAPSAAMARSRIALVEERAGQRQKAEADIRAALPVLERTLGVDHPWYLQSLVTFANLRESAGDVEQAEAIERRGLAAVERTGQTGTMLHATFINNLADILRARGDYAGAEPLFARSMAIGESILGGDSLFVATALQNLGIMARERKDYTAASPNSAARRFANGSSAPITRVWRACSRIWATSTARPARMRRHSRRSSARCDCGKQSSAPTRGKRSSRSATSRASMPAWATSSTLSSTSAAPTRFSKSRRACTSPPARSGRSLRSCARSRSALTARSPST